MDAAVTTSHRALEFLNNMAIGHLDGDDCKSEGFRVMLQQIANIELVGLCCVPRMGFVLVWSLTATWELLFHIEDRYLFL